MTPKFDRRTWLAVAGTTTVAASRSFAKADDEPFVFCFNTSTISGHTLKVPLVEEFQIVSRAGYRAIEPWVREIDGYVKAGGSLKDLRKRAGDLGLTIVDAIGFVEWIVDDEARRRKGLEEAKRVMGMIQELDCPHLAAPPVGATDTADLNLQRASERYAALLELGQTMGVTPMVEHWGHSKCVSRLGDAVRVAMESGHPKACVLPDVFHMYKSGSDFQGMKLLGKAAFPILHVNDYPEVNERAKIRDDQRVYPGDGVAPLGQLFASLRAMGWRGFVSLELFNKDYYKRDPSEVATTGLAKMKAASWRHRSRND
ncbi:MAG: sugar phosphate isomerase/epimerase family protein [Gemmataceae bacterium]